MNPNSRLLLIILTLLSALLLPLALPNELFLDGNPVLGLICLSFFFLALYRAPSFGFASVLGMIFGAVSTVIANYWLVNFGQFSVWTLGGSTLGYIGYNALLAPILYGCAKIKPRYRALLTAAVWALYEYLKSSGFLGYPWGLVAYPVHTVLPLIQFVDVTGLWGLSFLMAYFNSVGAEIIDQVFPLFFNKRKSLPLAKQVYTSWKNYSLVLAAFLIAILGYGTARLLIPIPLEKQFDILLIQQNRDPWERGMHAASVSTARKLTLQGVAESLAKSKKRPDLIAWNETALRHLGRSDLEFFSSTGTYNLVGAPLTISTEPFRAYNASILISPAGQPLTYYAKQHPVPFAESIPLWDIPEVQEFFRNVIGISNLWALGSKYTVFEPPLQDGGTISFGTPICFEDVFPDLCRHFFLNGAEVLINMSNDSWSKTNSALTQHIAAARFRAIENRRTLIRATNAGLTCVVGVKGEILSSIPIFEQNYLLTSVPVYKESGFTTYTLLGDYFAFCLALIILFILIENALQFSLLEFLTKKKK
ncbi:MAG: apolipoprotein N-acyltransferase [Spirochaetales bacterium]|nr:apolipoprotein N-acyltransferase [Spirochaetales bacterium]